MSIAITVWGAVAIFSALMFLCIREATTLALFLSAVNALALAFMQNNVKYSATIFALSFTVIILFAAITSVIISVKEKTNKKR